MWSGWRDSSATNDAAGGGTWPNSISRAATRRRMNFSVELKIGTCQCVERCFLARLPPKCRSERDAPVGVLIGRNGGR